MEFLFCNFAHAVSSPNSQRLSKNYSVYYSDVWRKKCNLISILAFCQSFIIQTTENRSILAFKDVLFADCAPDDYFNNLLGSYLGIVTRFMDNIYLSDTSHYIDCLVSLCKSASKGKFWNFFPFNCCIQFLAKTPLEFQEDFKNTPFFNKLPPVPAFVFTIDN